MFEHQKLVRSLVKPGQEIIDNLTPGQANSLHMTIGISGEAGELLDAMKKHLIYGKPLDVCNVIEELGDIEFYLEGLRQELKINREEVLSVNVRKLNVRYPAGRYSDGDAQSRKDKEVAPVEAEGPPARPLEQRLVSLAWTVLDILASTPDWDTDTLAAVADAAVSLDLAETGVNREFCIKTGVNYDKV